MKDGFAIGCVTGLIGGLLIGVAVGFLVVPPLTWYLPDGPSDFLIDIEYKCHRALLPAKTARPPPPHSGPAPS